MPELNQTTVLREIILSRVNTDGSVTSSQEGVALKNDSDSPGANKVYGTDASGVRGWKDDPSGGGLADHLTDTDNPHEVTSEQLGLEVMVDDYGTIVSGVTDCSEIIELAIAAAGTYGAIRFTAGKTYIINEKVTLPIGLSMIGYGAIIKRKNAIHTTLSGAEIVGATVLEVASASGFAVGDEIIVCDTTLTFGGRGQQENSATGGAFSAPQVITAINGTTITVSNGLGRAMPAGAVVVKVYDLFDGAASTASTSGFGNKIIGLEFDGNVTNNNYTNSWVFNKTIDNLPMNSLIRDCTFHDIPSENLFLSNNTTVTNCRAYDLKGSFVHISQAASDNTGKNMLIGNRIKGVCTATNDCTGHSEGAFTMSDNPQTLFVHDNYVEDCSESFLSPISDLSNHVSIIGNKGFNCKGVVEIYNFTGVAERWIISNNIFEDCQFIAVTANQGAGNDDFVETGRGHDHFKISGNQLINVKVYLQRASNFQITDNNFVTTSDHTYSSTNLTAGTTAHIALTRCTQYSIIGNTFDNRATTLDTRLKSAINCEFNFNLNLSLAQPLKSGASTSTEYCYYNRNVKIADNKIHNYQLGILDYYAGSEVLPARSLSWIGFEISNNLIVLRSSSANYGIVAGPGAIIHDNKIYSTSATVAALVALGVNDGTGSTYNNGGTQSARLNGAIVYRNTIIGADKSIQVGSTSAVYGNNIYNCQVRDNFIDGTVTDNTSGNSTISGNVTLVNESLNLQIVRQNPEWY